MIRYSLAGPDIGVRCVTFAELCEEVGQDNALDLASTTENGKFQVVPGMDPIRVVRVHKAGDENLGYEYFARKAGLSPDDQRRQYHRDVETPAEGADGSFKAGSNSAGMFRGIVTVTTQVNVRVWIAAKSQQEANAALLAYTKGEPMPEGFEGHLNFPAAEVASGAHRALIEARGDFAEAGWTLTVKEGARKPSEAETAAMMQSIMVENRVHEALATLV